MAVMESQKLDTAVSIRMNSAVLDRLRAKAKAAKRRVADYLRLLLERDADEH